MVALSPHTRWYFTPSVAVMFGTRYMATLYGFVFLSHQAIGAYRELPISPTIAGCFAVADAKAADIFSP